MPGGGPVSAGQGPQQYAFLPTGPTQPIALAASSVTVTLSQFVSTAPYAKQAAFVSIGAAAANSLAYVTFGSGVTTSPTVGVPIVPVGLMSALGASVGSGMQILTTGKTPVNVAVIGAVGTVTVYITPGDGSR